MALSIARKKLSDLRVAVVLLALCTLLTGCGGKVAVVSAAQATMQPITRTSTANGRVELTEDFQARASAPTTVKQIFVKVGDSVQQGQELLRLDDSDARLRMQTAGVSIASAQNALSNIRNGGNAEELLTAGADMTSAQLTLRQARDTLKTKQQLQTTGAASANEVAAAQADVTAAQNRVNALRARETKRFSNSDITLQQEQIARSQAEMASAQSDLANFDVRAPFAGTVYGLPVMPYAAVTPGEDLVNVANLNKVRVRAYFDEPEIGRLAVGQPVKITWEARPERTWVGHITATPTSITQYGTRNVGECLVSVDDARGDLIPNVNVTVYVTTLHKDNVLAVPREALRTNGSENFVYRIVDGKLRRTPVQVGVLSSTLVQITSGLQPGDTVVRLPENDVEIKDGGPVRIQP